MGVQNPGPSANMISNTFLKIIDVRVSEACTLPNQDLFKNPRYTVWQFWSNITRALNPEKGTPNQACQQVGSSWRSYMQHHGQSLLAIVANGSNSVAEARCGNASKQSSEGSDHLSNSQRAYTAISRPWPKRNQAGEETAAPQKANLSPMDRWRQEDMTGQAWHSLAGVYGTYPASHHGQQSDKRSVIMNTSDDDENLEAKQGS